jgi:glutathione-regulated potassium-efflux system protein KefB
MDPAHADLSLLSLPLVLLAAAVISVPLAQRIKLSAIVAYLAAGVVIGPYGLGLFTAPATILAVSELGVVLLLFLIGLELEASRLVAMRRDIFGLGAAQFLLTAAVLGVIAWTLSPFDWRGAVVAGFAFALSSTAIALRMLEERGHLQQTYGQRAFAILLFQDMAVVPLLALLPFLAPGTEGKPSGLLEASRSAALIAAGIAAVVVAGRYLLLVVLGAAVLMQAVGMSMALGAFLAGVLLAESNYRHELEADIEPFRGLLLALFFMGVGMSIDMAVVLANIWLIIGWAIVITLLKAGIVGALFHAVCAKRSDSLRAGAVLTAASEFAFVVFPLAVSLGIVNARQASLLAAIAAVTMLIGPPFASLVESAIRRFARGQERAADSFEGTQPSVLVIGFGRFGQIVSQYLLAEAVDVTTIDRDPDMIQTAGRFGFKVYYGDGTRLDVLRAAGLDKARLIAICIDDQEACNRIVDLVRAEFPGTRIFARSFDRGHTLQLLAKDVDYELRETFESALRFGRETLLAMGIGAERAGQVEDFIRARDRDRIAIQQAEGIYAGMDLLRQRPQMTPFTAPQRAAKPLNEEAEEIIREKTDARESAS